MRFLVGQVAGGSAVFLVSGHNAINMKERQPSIGSDLMGIIPHNTWRLRYFSLLFY